MTSRSVIIRFESILFYFILCEKEKRDVHTFQSDSSSDYGKEQMRNNK